MISKESVMVIVIGKTVSVSCLTWPIAVLRIFSIMRIDFKSPICKSVKSKCKHICSSRNNAVILVHFACETALVLQF